MSNDNDHDRRTVLKMASGITAGFAFASVGAARSDDDSASVDGVDTEDCNCYYEYKCDGGCYKNGSYPQSWERECCECDNGTVCDDWQRMNQCCL